MKTTGKSRENGNAKRGGRVARPKVEARRLTIGLAAFEKVSAIEGLHLTRDMKEMFRMLDRQGASAAERRAVITKRYG